MSSKNSYECQLGNFVYLFFVIIFINAKSVKTQACNE